MAEMVHNAYTLWLV